MVRQRRLWRSSDATIPGQFVKVVESEVLPMLRPLNRYENFSLFHRENIFRMEWFIPKHQILLEIDIRRVGVGARDMAKAFPSL